MRLRLPGGWHGRIEARLQPGPTQLAFVLEAANFSLPKLDDDFGTAASKRMRADDIRILLMEFPAEQVGTQGFRPTALLLRVRPSDFRSGQRFASPQHALARRHFATARRAFSMFVEFGRRRPSPGQVALVDSVLATLLIRPRPELDPLVWVPLRRPLHLPSRTGACRPARVARSMSASAFPLGSGPAYPNVGSGNGVAGLGGDLVRNGWFLHKTLWAIAPSYRGAILIRGRRLDQPGAVQFQGHERELRVPALPGGVPPRWRYLATSTDLRGPGCYGYQIDGVGFSRVVVFKASNAS